MIWNLEKALAFVRKDQGEPTGCRWQAKGGGGGDVIAWGVVSPPIASDKRGPDSRPKFWPNTTAWNGRGNGESPDYEYSLECVRLPASLVLGEPCRHDDLRNFLNPREIAEEGRRAREREAAWERIKEALP